MTLATIYFVKLNDDSGYCDGSLVEGVWYTLENAIALMDGTDDMVKYKKLDTLIETGTATLVSRVVGSNSPV